MAGLQRRSLCRGAFAAALALLTVAGSAVALDNGLSLQPHRGWSSWNYFKCRVGNGTSDLNENAVNAMADAIVASGLAKAGYTIVALDDCYLAKERVGGKLAAGPTFPSGMNALGDRIHARSLLFGVYLDCGTETCGGYPGSQGYEDADAATIAEWGADYMKYDECHSTPSQELHRFFQMRDALNATGRPIVYTVCPAQSRCNGDPDKDYDFWDASSVANANMCRGDRFSRSRFCGRRNCTAATQFETVATPSAGDSDSVDGGSSGSGGHHGHRVGGLPSDGTLLLPPPSPFPLGDIAPNWCSFNCLLDANVGYNSGQFAGPGHWIISDMLEVGMGMSVDEDTAHFTLWCVMSFPLMLGHDVRTQSADTLRILTNAELLAVSGDVLGRPARLAVGDLDSPTQVYVRQLHTGDYVAVLFNRHDTDMLNVTLPWRAMAWPAQQPAAVRDLWQHRGVGTFAGNYTASVRPHAVVAVRLSQLPTNASASPDHDAPAACPCDVASAAQRWRIAPTRQLVSPASGRCLDVYECDPAGTPNNVDMFECRDPSKQHGCGALNQLWSVNPNGTVTSALDGGCLSTVLPGSGQCRALATLPCRPGDASQLWAPRAGGTWAQGSLCLTA